MTVAFQSKKNNSEGGSLVYFEEKHYHLIGADMSVSDLDAVVTKRFNQRGFGGQGANQNSLLCMTAGQTQAFFAWIGQFKSNELAKVKKGPGYTDISGIPNLGCVITRNKAGTITRRGGGTLTLGFVRQTGTKELIVHFTGHNWDGSFNMVGGTKLSAAQAGAFK